MLSQCPLYVGIVLLSRENHDEIRFDLLSLRN